MEEKRAGESHESSIRQISVNEPVDRLSAPRRLRFHKHTTALLDIVAREESRAIHLEEDEKGEE